MGDRLAGSFTSISNKTTSALFDDGLVVSEIVDSFPNVVAKRPVTVTLIN